MGKCADKGIPINFISPQGEFLTRVQGKVRGNIFLGKAQFEKFSNPDPILMKNTVNDTLGDKKTALFVAPPAGA